MIMSHTPMSNNVRESRSWRPYIYCRYNLKEGNEGVEGNEMCHDGNECVWNVLKLYEYDYAIIMN